MPVDFEGEITKRIKNRKRFDGVSNIIGGIKVLLAMIILGTVYALWEYHFAAVWLCMAVMEAVIFAVACFCHNRYIEKTKHEDGLMCIHRTNIMRKDGEWQNFPDIGEEYIDGNHDYAMDLDIVGEKSLFQFLNSTHTCYGRTAFSKDLLNAHYTVEEIKDRQEAVAELSGKYEFAGEMEYRFSKIGYDARFSEGIDELKKTERFFVHGWMKTAIYVLRLFTMTAVIAALVLPIEHRWTVGGIMLGIQIILCILGERKIKRYIGVLYRSACKIDSYYPVVEEIIGQEFTSGKMKRIKEQAEQAKRAVRRLSHIYENVSQCHNGIMKTILDAFFLWSYQNALDLEKWKKEYGDSIEDCFKMLGELESLLSFANLPRICDGVSLPEYTGEENVVRAEAMGHPLIANDKRVCNDIALCQQIFIISGSNMSGKTTFMRTTGINLVLAFAGSFVCAQRMVFSTLGVVTSMRIADDLREGTSTFYAELKRIKQIIDRAGKDRRTLFLIDEIFRGTNSVDRMKGAEGVLLELWRCGAVGMITTHDLEICRLAGEQEEVFSEMQGKAEKGKKDRRNIVNYSFCESYQGDKIFFDYRLKPGKSTTTNGEYLLKQIGILKSEE